MCGPDALSLLGLFIRPLKMLGDTQPDSVLRPHDDSVLVLEQHNPLFWLEVRLMQRCSDGPGRPASSLDPRMMHMGDGGDKMQ